ncbi:unnamed protein product [Prunus armeniaca]|uniref:Uncharacterized protein n=1 Tax=Prunus armeniaca TaxID=36596 RepID=A0A6J5XAA7_PRUAR|nr:unnamed protein product [Prunus armeniaca]
MKVFYRERLNGEPHDGCSFSGSQFPDGHNYRSWNHGNPDDDLWILPLAAGSSQAILALPSFISQLWLMGNTELMQLKPFQDPTNGQKGAYKNDFIGLEFDPMIPGDQKLTGDFIIQHMFGIPIDHSKWWDLAAIVAILVSYRVLFFVILKFKENALPLFQTLYAKRTLQQLDKRPSFRKVPSISSKRHQPLHSLSSQEGLNSPLQ